MKSKLRSLLFPVVNIAIPLIFICVQTLGSNKKLADLLFLFSFTLLFGVVAGGIVPILFIVMYHIDVSEYFKPRLIALLISAGICFLSWLDTSGPFVIIAPVVSACLTVFYIARKHLHEELHSSHGKRKLFVMAISNPILLYLGFVLDFVISFLSSGQGFHIPG